MIVAINIVPTCAAVNNVVTAVPMNDILVGATAQDVAGTGAPILTVGANTQRRAEPSSEDPLCHRTARPLEHFRRGRLRPIPREREKL